jgi:uncharacterized DUF497 family protein
VRFKFDPHKSSIIKANPKRGISFDEAKSLWDKPYYEDFRSDDPEQFRALGWVGETLFTIIYEIREDNRGEYYHLVTLWKSTRQEVLLYEQHIK